MKYAERLKRFSAEKSSKEYKEGAECATYVHGYIKDEIRKRVKNGEYKIVDGKKHVKFYTDKDTFLWIIWTSCNT